MGSDRYSHPLTDFPKGKRLDIGDVRDLGQEILSFEPVRLAQSR